MTLLFASAMALSAFLVFWVQPLVARMLLPVLGGSPSVWNTCILFFQGVLLLGYLYVHVLTKLRLPVQGAVHVIAVLLAVSLAPAVAGQWAPPGDDSTVLWLLASLMLYVGLPFGVLTSSAPLLQHWFGRVATEKSQDPYFLYAASNTGSLLALFLFPILLERFLPLSEQIDYWRLSYVFLAVGIFACLGIALNRQQPAKEAVTEVVSHLPTRTIAKWLLYAFIPSSLMLGVTTHITTDIAAISLFWVVPLALYLLTYIIAFSDFGVVADRVAKIGLPVLIVGLLANFFRSGAHTILQLPLQLGIVACISQILHSRLYQSRPPQSRLTLFYVCIAVGGFLGGLFNGLVAPLIFDRIVEFQVVLAIGLLAAEWQMLHNLWGRFLKAQWYGFRLAQAVGIAVFAFLIAYWITGFGHWPKMLLIMSMVFLSAGAGAYAVGPLYGGRFAALLCFLLYLGMSVAGGVQDNIYAGRSFFGPFSVRETEDSGQIIRTFVHGTTVHGSQAEDPQHALRLQSYYAAIGPVVGDFLTTRRAAHIGITGLGTGNSACIGRDIDQVTFYEIDPQVEDVAREYFTYLSACPPSIDVVLGDARQSLRNVADNSFDVLILDAFTSDAIPVHLLTDEAAQEYERVLKEDGLMAFNISNRYLNVRPVLAALAKHRNWQAWFLETGGDTDEVLTDPSTFVIVAMSSAAESAVNRLQNIEPIGSAGEIRLWTDDYSNVFDILIW